jgi:hypothetical protein
MIHLDSDEWPILIVSVRGKSIPVHEAVIDKTAGGHQLSSAEIFSANSLILKQETGSRSSIRQVRRAGTCRSIESSPQSDTKKSTIRFKASTLVDARR